MNLVLSGANLINDGRIIIDDSTEIQQKAYHMLISFMSYTHNRMEVLDDKFVSCFNNIHNLTDDHIENITDYDIMFAIDLRRNLYDYFIISMRNNQYKQAVIALAGHIIESFIGRDSGLIDDNHNNLYALSMISRSNDDFLNLMRMVIPMLTMPDEPLIESLKTNMSNYDYYNKDDINAIITHLCNGHDIAARRLSRSRRSLPHKRIMQEYQDFI